MVARQGRDTDESWREGTYDDREAVQAQPRTWAIGRASPLSTQPWRHLRRARLRIEPRLVRLPADIAYAAEFAVFLGDHLLHVETLEPIPEAGALLLNDLALALTVGIALQLGREESVPLELSVELSGDVASAWTELFELLAKLGGPRVRIVARLVSDPSRPPAHGTVALVSGGKDTLFALRRNSGLLAGKCGIYLGRGATIEWLDELPRAAAVANRFGLRLEHVALAGVHVSARAARHHANRASWRELVTLGLARMYGDFAITGINDDAIARLTTKVDNAVDFFAHLTPVLRILEQILGMRISMAPGELEVYRALRNDPDFNPAGSCVLPQTCGQPDLCAKCRTFAVYETHLAGLPLGPDDMAFIHSERYLGDACLVHVADGQRRRHA
jgi:hypothetical protein